MRTLQLLAVRVPSTAETGRSQTPVFWGGEVGEKTSGVSKTGDVPLSAARGCVQAGRHRRAPLGPQQRETALDTCPSVALQSDIRHLTPGLVPQVTSVKASAARTRVGTADRSRSASVQYLSEEHATEKLCRGSPPPGTYSPRCDAVSGQHGCTRVLSRSWTCKGVRWSPCAHGRGWDGMKRTTSCRLLTPWWATCSRRQCWEARYVGDVTALAQRVP